MKISALRADRWSLAMNSDALRKCTNGEAKCDTNAFNDININEWYMFRMAAICDIKPVEIK